MLALGFVRLRCLHADTTPLVSQPPRQWFYLYAAAAGDEAVRNHVVDFGLSLCLLNADINYKKSH